MKTNFLCKDALPRGRYVFSRLSLLIIALTCFCFANYAQTVPEPGQQQHLYLKLHKNDPMTPDNIKVKPLSDDPNAEFSYSHYAHVDTETATLRLLEGSDAVTPDDGVAFHAQLTLMEEVPSLFIRFGVSIGNFKRTYSLKNEKLYYDKGYVEVAKGKTIDIYYDGNAYQMTYDGVPFECITGAFNGLRETFVSTYGRLNTGGEVDLMFEPYSGGIISNCVVGCQPDFVGADAIAICNIVEPDECTSGQGNKYEIDDSQSFTTYPNPVNHQLTVNINPLIDEDLILRIVDATGRIVHLHPISVIARNDNMVRIDVNHLSGGIYYIKIDSEYQFETQKIIIIK